MDLSKAIDCLPHDILLHKLQAYGVSENSIKLLKSYLSNRQQQIKIGSYGCRPKNYQQIPNFRFRWIQYEVVKLLGVDIDCKLKFDSHVPAVRTTSYGKNSFKYAAPVLWNSLPDHLRTCSCFSQFKTLISSWSGKDCKCIACDSG
ncbi:hypothetical protein DPMN_032315 [Dreissena polymorpha]|uniref:Reverse transcriptase domain-containing protein n=1 Tax=Dreissena polymorpha TaxID=45954 RepID=A0A9D4M4G5_DREPO|nr:hypothetical protein DPMN_032315 [Dreissena polymorpha]